MSLFDELFGSQGQDPPAEEPQEEVAAEESHSDEWEEQMTEAELRLQKASYYRILLDDHLFDDHSNEICAEIEKEMRQFVRTRLGVLLNLTSEKESGTELFSTQEVSALKAVAASFNAQEIAVLKTLAAKIVSKPSLIGQATVKPAEPVKPAPPPKPTLKKRSIPDKKPEVAPKPVVAPPVQQKPKKQADKPAVKKPAEASFEDGEVVKEGDRTYRIKWIEERADYEPPPGVGKIVKNGHTYKVLKMDITKQTPAPGYIPMPSVGQMRQITEMKANEVVAIMPGTMAGIAATNRDRGGE